MGEPLQRGARTMNCSALRWPMPRPCSRSRSLPRTVAGWDVVRWAGALPFASLGHKQRVAAVRSVCAADGTLAVVGGWLSGNGLAAIVADTPRQVRTLLP